MFVFHAKSKDLKKNRYFDQNCIDLSPMIIDSWKAAWCCRCQVSGIVSHVCLCLKTARLAAQLTLPASVVPNCWAIFAFVCRISECAPFFFCSCWCCSQHSSDSYSYSIVLFFFAQHTVRAGHFIPDAIYKNACLLVTQSVPWNSPEITSSGRRYGTGTGSSATHWYSIHSKLKNNMNKWRINKCYIFLLLFEQILWENLLWHCRLFDGNRVESI